MLPPTNEVVCLISPNWTVRSIHSNANLAPSTEQAPERPMSRGVVRRQDLAMSAEDVEDLLRRAAVAHFATVGADGEPYVVPNLFVYAEHRSTRLNSSHQLISYA